METVLLFFYNYALHDGPEHVRVLTSFSLDFEFAYPSSAP